MGRISVGEKMPDFCFNTGFENNKHLSDYLQGKTVLWVLRYIGCTTCRYEAHLINQRYGEFTAKNAKVLMVMQSDQEHIQKDLDQYGEKFAFDIVCDPEMKIYKELEILPGTSKEAMRGPHPEKLMEKIAKIREAGFVHGDYEGDELQLPAMFILDEEGTVVYAHYAEYGSDMPSIDEVLEML